MIIDFEIELYDLESQPAWVGVDHKITDLINERKRLVSLFDRNPKEYVLKQIEKTENDIELFKSILTFWAINYNKMKHLKEKFEFHAKEINKHADTLQLIDDLKMIVENDQQLFVMTSEMMLLKFQDKDFSDSLNKIKETANKYYLILKKKLSEQV